MKSRSWVPRGNNGSDPSRFYPRREQLYSDLYQSTSSPYEGLTVTPSRRPFFSLRSNAYNNMLAINDEVREELSGRSPRLIVEVGSFVGAGATTWGSIAKSAPQECLVICIDTWQGDLAMRLEMAYHNLADIKHAFPAFGEVFMERMIYEGLQETVYPLPMPATLGARLLYVLGYKVDIVYIDSAHERGDTLVELHIYYQLLRPGGLLMGDDAQGFPAVWYDLQLFAACYNLSLKIFAGEQWVIRKPR